MSDNGRTADMVSLIFLSLFYTAPLCLRFTSCRCGCILTKCVASDQCNGREREVGDSGEQREETGTVGCRVGVRLI